MPEQYHEMQLETIHSSGTEEWYCPTCGRRFLLDWPPHYQRIILDVGDDAAAHSGGKGGLSMTLPEINVGKEPKLPETVLAAVNKILEKFDLDEPPDNSARNNE